MLRRVGRSAVVICGVMVVAALVIAGGRPRPALAVAAGGLLSLVSYRLILASAGGLGRSLEPAPAEPAGESPETPGAAPRRPGGPALAAGRYALLGLLAYVMIARLRLPPLGLLAGASSVVAAVSLEAVRFLSKKTS